MQREELSCTSFSDNAPGQPLASKMQSPFHQIHCTASPPLSFIHVCFLFSFVFPPLFLIFILFSSLSPSLSSSHPPLVEYDGGNSHSYASLCADECWLQRGIKLQYGRVCVHVSVCWCLLYICGASSGRPAAPWAKESVTSSSAAVRG